MSETEFANETSEVLCGYREAGWKQMLKRATELVETEKSARLMNYRKELKDATDNLVSVIEQIEGR